MSSEKEKNKETLLHLYKEVAEADVMILHLIRSNAGSLFNNIIRDRMFIKEGQTMVEIPVEEFNKLRVFLAQLSFSADNLRGIDNLMPTYIDKKENAHKIIHMLE